MTGGNSESTGVSIVSSGSVPPRRTWRALLIGSTESVPYQFVRYLAGATPGFLKRLTAPSGTSWLFSACTAAAGFTFCLLIQGLSGAWSAGFVAYPDEPAHFVGAVMVRDWLVSHQWSAPLAFARNYYDHYPFFAVGYWPPLFSIVAGLWLLVAGVGRLQALLIPAVFAAATGWLVCRWVRRRAGMVAGLCAGALYLSLPAVRQSMCAVMVDNMTAFFCIAAAVCLLRYLKQPVFLNGIIYGVACACAILSKYSAAYTLALPVLAILLLRRLELLRKPSFLVQPFVVALIVGPWAMWTRNLALYGLPAERVALTVKHAASFVLATFEIFSPVLMVFIVLGLIALLVRPRAWREDFVVLSLLGGGHLAFLISSPVGVEPRYLLVPAAAVLVASFAGWSEALTWMSHGGRQASVISGFAAILTAVFVVSQFGSFARMPQDHIRNAVAFIAKDPARAAQCVVVPPTLEGPVIAEFVAQSRHRPDHYLLRPSKILARGDWFAFYSFAFATSGEMMEYFRQHPVSLIMWNERPEVTLNQHGATLKEMLQQYPLWWHKVKSFSSQGGLASSWTIYEYRASP